MTHDHLIYNAGSLELNSELGKILLKYDEIKDISTSAIYDVQKILLFFTPICPKLSENRQNEGIIHHASPLRER